MQPKHRARTSRAWRFFVVRQSDVGRCALEGVVEAMARRHCPITACDVGPPLQDSLPAHIARRHFGGTQALGGIRLIYLNKGYSGRERFYSE